MLHEINSNRDEENETSADEVFEETMQENHKTFPEYKQADVYRFSVTDNFQAFVKKVMDIEAPVSEEWLLKRIPWMFGREKSPRQLKMNMRRRCSAVKEMALYVAMDFYIHRV